MTSLKLLFRPSRVEGKEGILYIRVIHDRVARQVNLGCKLRSREWKDGRVNAHCSTLLNNGGNLLNTPYSMAVFTSYLATFLLANSGFCSIFYTFASLIRIS